MLMICMMYMFGVTIGSRIKIAAITRIFRRAALFLVLVMIKPSLQFVFDLLVQQAGGLDKQDDEQDDERECITVGSGDVGRANGFDDAQDDAAQQGTPQVADTAQDSSGEGFHTDGWRSCQHGRRSAGRS